MVVALVLLIGLPFVLQLGAYFLFVPSVEARAITPRTAWRVGGSLALWLAAILAVLRLPCALVPYLAKLLLHAICGFRYKTARNGYLIEAIGIVGDVANLVLITGLVLLLVRPPGPTLLGTALYLPLGAEFVRLYCEKGQMVVSAIWQVLPHRAIAAKILARRTRRAQGGCLARYCRYYALTDEARLEYVVAVLKRRAALDAEVADRLAYLEAFRLVPRSHSLRSGHVRDVAAGEVFIHRDWTNDPWLLIGQALRRTPWIFDPRYLRRPFRYRSQANPLVTHFVLQSARYSPPYAIYQFGHEIKAARFALFYRACRWIGRDIEEPVRAEGIHNFDPLLLRLIGRSDQLGLADDQRSLWTEIDALADLRQRVLAGERLSVQAIAERYTFPRKYVEDVLIRELVSAGGYSIRVGPRSKQRRILLGHALLLPFAGMAIPLVLLGRLVRATRQGGASSRPTASSGVKRRTRPVWKGLTRFGNCAGGPGPMCTIVGLMLAVLIRRGHRRDALFCALATGGAATTNTLIKLVVRRARPRPWRSVVPGSRYSFPSGHATNSFATAATALVLLWPTRWRWPALGVAGPFVALVGMSRLYLGIHYPADILAGWCVSVAWVAGMRLLLGKVGRTCHRRIMPGPDGAATGR
jgi:undecaprenyl-diphosphatase